MPRKITMIMRVEKRHTQRGFSGSRRRSSSAAVDVNRTQQEARLADTSIVYGKFVRGGRPSDLVFLPHAQAEHLASIFLAICGAETWGELRGAMSTEADAELLAWLESNGWRKTRKPQNDDPFDLDAVPGVVEGDWPPWPDQLHLAWMPQDIVKAYGDIEQSVHNGAFVAFSAEKEQLVVGALKEHGYHVERNDTVIAHACGYIPC